MSSVREAQSSILVTVLVALCGIVMYQSFQINELRAEVHRMHATDGNTALNTDDIAMELSTVVSDTLKLELEDWKNAIMRSIASSTETTVRATDSTDKSTLQKEDHSDAPVAQEDVHDTSRFINFVYGLWDSKPMSDGFKSNLQAWRRLNPAWEVKVWNKAQIKALWRDEFPEHKDLWRRSRPIQQADISRLMIVYKYGGLYADLDTTPTKALDDLMHNSGFRHVAHNTLLCIEDYKTDAEMAASAKWPIRKGEPEFRTRIANYVFWARPQSPLIKRALNLATQRLREVPSSMYHVNGRPDLNNPYAIIYTTGPDVLTEATFVKHPTSGERDLSPQGVFILEPDACSMYNQATGTWTGDGNAATSLKK
eukprot:m.263404 g.263404  ORF g.263404 m.263404 type:complete len:368 (+) comp19707_c1_seq10:331-1434(+)